MIDYIKVHDPNLNLIGIIDTAQSVIWRADYYGAGFFEVYVLATMQTVGILQEGFFVSRDDDVNIGIIESVNIAYNPQDGRMVIAKGRFAKSILDRRLIYNLSGTSLHPTISSGLVEVAARNLVNRNIIASTVAARNISLIKLGTLNGITKRIVDEDGDAARKQTSFGNLLEYTDTMLAEYHLGAYMSLDGRKLAYNVFEGIDRSMGNEAGNAPLIFSQDFDNLLSSDYLYDTTAHKNVVLIGGEGEGVDRFCVLLGSASGMNRREVWLDASGQSKTYTDEQEQEKSYTDAEYSAILKTAGAQSLAPLSIVQTFNGGIDLTNSGLTFGVDYWVGDVITIQDAELGIYINARIISATEVQDASGYRIDIEYGV